MPAGRRQQQNGNEQQNCVGQRCDTAGTANRERGGGNTCDISLGVSGSGSVSRTKFCSRASLPLCRSRLRASTSGLYVVGRGPSQDDGQGLEGTFLLAMRFMRRGSDSMWNVCLCSKLTTGAAAAELPTHQQRRAFQPVSGFRRR